MILILLKVFYLLSCDYRRPQDLFKQDQGFLSLPPFLFFTTLQRKSRKGQSKRYSKIDQYLARHYKYNGAGLSSTPPFLCSQKNSHFFNSMISVNQKIGLYFQPTVESVYPYSSSILEFLMADHMPLLFIYQTNL